MAHKSKRAAHKPAAAASPPAARSQLATPGNALRRPDCRWQRSVRYGWDKGGSRGGR